MIIPDRVIICGITNDVKMEDYLYYDSGILAGEYRNNDKVMTICRGSNGRENGKLKPKTYSVEEITNTFYHELWHAICFSAGYEYNSDDDDIHNELTANLFGNIAMDKGNDCDLTAILNEFKTVVTNIDEQDYHKLEYVVKHTKFEFDNLQHIDEDSEIVDDINIAD